MIREYIYISSLLPVSPGQGQLRRVNVYVKHARGLGLKFSASVNLATLGDTIRCIVTGKIMV